MGEYARFLNWAIFAAPYMSLGLVPYFTRELGKLDGDDARMILKQGTRRVVVLAAVAAGLFAVAEGLREVEGAGPAVHSLLAISIGALVSGSLLMGGLLRGLGLPLWSDLPLYLAPPTIMAIAVLFLQPQTQDKLFLIYGIAQFGAFLILATRLAHYTNWRFEIAPGPGFKSQLLISVAATSLVTAGQLALAGLMFDSSSMANLHLGYAFANSVNLAFAAVLAVHQKDISRAHSLGSTPELQRALNTTNKALLAIGAPILAALALAAPMAHEFLPEGYDIFTRVALLFLLGQVFNIMGGPSAMFFLMVGGEKYLNYTLLPSAIGGLTLAHFAAEVSVEAFVACLALMTLAWNGVLVMVAKRLYGVNLHVFSPFQKRVAAG